MKALLKRLLPESFRKKTRRWRGAWIARLAQRTNLTREPLSHIFIQGQGIEIGPLNWPQDVPAGVDVKIVDQMSRADLCLRFPEFAAIIPPVDFVSKIDTLEAIKDASQDFVVANHVLEHSENPILAMSNMLRVLKPNGVLFLTLPDKRYTFDHLRPVTPLSHLIRDFDDGPDWSRLDHYREAGKFLKNLPDSALDAYAADLAAKGQDTHFHVWTQSEMFELLVYLQREQQLGFDIEAMSKTGLEVIFVLRKHDGNPIVPDEGMHQVL
ncbi:MAG TPA: methyltransferase domain-containing protein [Fimbriimonadaceae bacterium]|nr:methyltransferase domain-containing protein [Fimbriimonadaceae bacterium]